MHESVNEPRLENSLTLVIPVYNEAQSLPTTIPEVADHCRRRQWKVIIVNDGSTDATREILSQYDDVPSVKIMHHKVNRGYGAAIKTAIGQVDTEFLVTIDADGQHRLADVDALYEACRKNNADMVVGNHGKGSSNLYREIGKWIIRKIVRILLPISIHDLNSGMKLYQTKLAQEYAPICPDSMAFSDIIALTFLGENHLVIEHPITVRKRLGGESTIKTQTAFETVLKILSIITMFNPMRLFLPVSLLSVLAGILWGIPIALRGNGVSVGAMLAITTGIICFFLGLVAEQLSLIRKSKIR